MNVNDRLTLVCIDEEALTDKVREQIDKAARHLYGLIHARFVITTRGLAKMVSNAIIRVRMGWLICVMIVGQVQEGWLWSLPKSSLQSTSLVTSWFIWYSLHQDCQALLSTMWRHLQSQIFSTCNYWWCLFRYIFPTHALPSTSFLHATKVIWAIWTTYLWLQDPCNCRTT